MIPFVVPFAETDRLAPGYENAIDVDDVGLEGRERLLESVVVRELDLFQFVIACHERVIIHAIEQQAPLHVASLLCHVHAMCGGQHMHAMAAELQQIDQRLAAKIKCPGVVGRIEVRDDKDFHAAPR